MRLFIAIDPPPEIQKSLSLLQQKLAHARAAVRWTDPAQYHITVKFIGEVPDPPHHLLPEISQRLTRAAAETPPFALHVEGVGKFPPRGPTRVIIAHVLSRDLRIVRLHRLIDSALGGIGLPMDTRRLTPHLTLGRVQTNHGLNRLLRLLPKHEFDDFGSFDVREVHLYQSTPSSSGSKGSLYQKIHTAPLPPPIPATTSTP